MHASALYLYICIARGRRTPAFHSLSVRILPPPQQHHFLITNQDFTRGRVLKNSVCMAHAPTHVAVACCSRFHSPECISCSAARPPLKRISLILMCYNSGKQAFALYVPALYYEFRQTLALSATIYGIVHSLCK